MHMRKLLTLVLVVGAVGQSCHGDVLLNYVKFSDLSCEEVQQVVQTAAKRIASEIGHVETDVSTRVFPGDFDAHWSPRKNRPPADVFLGSTIKNCKSPSDVLHVFQGPRLAQDLLVELKSLLENSGARTGQLAIRATSVTPAKELNPEFSAEFVKSGVGADCTGSSSSMGWVLALVVLAIVAGVAGFFVMKKMKDAQPEDSDDDSRPFTGH